MLSLAQRMPYFCSGCPHNSSTKVAPGTLVGGGIGCHAMVAFMPSEQVGEVIGLCQMGGEGSQWLGIAPFVTQQHLVQNLGDGTFAHSGSLAIRAAVASGANITFKLLRNSAVAMTGGQQAVGELPIDRLLALLKAEGVRKTVVTSDDPARLRRQLGWRADIRHRDDLIDVQRELAAIEGVTVLVHDQECAAEKRRKRRRGKVAAPAQRAFINERVCEGCGDCGHVSNCLSVQPVATEFGRKTKIHQSSCNLDFSCLNGDCPSFLTVIPEREPKAGAGSAAAPATSARSAGRPARGLAGRPAAELTTELTEPEPLFSPDGFTMRITGVGGTGVVTIAQILGTAFAADGHEVRSLDQTGLAQKGGAVVSDLTVSAGPSRALSQARLRRVRPVPRLRLPGGHGRHPAPLREQAPDGGRGLHDRGADRPDGHRRQPALPRGRPRDGRDRGEGQHSPFPRRGGAGGGPVRRRAVRQHDPGWCGLPGGRAAGQRRGDRARRPPQRRSGRQQPHGLPGRPDDGCPGVGRVRRAALACRIRRIGRIGRVGRR